jgi:hypothetical protein
MTCDATRNSQKAARMKAKSERSVKPDCAIKGCLELDADMRQSQENEK